MAKAPCPRWTALLDMASRPVVPADGLDARVYGDAAARGAEVHQR